VAGGHTKFAAGNTVTHLTSPSVAGAGPARKLFQLPWIGPLFGPERLGKPSAI